MKRTKKMSRKYYPAASSINEDLVIEDSNDVLYVYNPLKSFYFMLKIHEGKGKFKEKTLCNYQIFRDKIDFFSQFDEFPW